jgi:hypothetical protein
VVSCVLAAFLCIGMLPTSAFGANAPAPPEQPVVADATQPVAADTEATAMPEEPESPAVSEVETPPAEAPDAETPGELPEQLVLVPEQASAAEVSAALVEEPPVLKAAEAPATPTEGLVPWDGTVDTSWYSSATTSFDISTPAQLAGLASIVNSMQDRFVGKTVRLVADLDMGGVFADDAWSGPSWTAIGGGSSSSIWFGGTIDGAGHSIHNLYIDTASAYSAALVGRHEGTIKNLTIASGFIRCTGSGDAASFAVHSKALVYNCKNGARVVANTGRAGGIVANMSSAAAKTDYYRRGVIDNCVNVGDVSSATSNAGGIVAAIQGGNMILYSYNAAAVTGGTAGGISASTNQSTIANCYNAGNVTGTTAFGALGDLHASALPSGVYFLQTEQVNAGLSGASVPHEGVLAKSEEELKVLAPTLGTAFVADASAQNSGYPVLAWQAPGGSYPPTEIEAAGIATASNLTLTSVEVVVEPFLSYSNLMAGDFALTVSINGAEPVALPITGFAQTHSGGISSATLSFATPPKASVPQEFMVAVRYRVGQPVAAGSFSQDVSPYWTAYGTQPTSGDGSPDTPYLIGSAAELAWFAAQVNAGNRSIHGRLVASFSLAGHQWVPIGSQAAKFTGAFDGAGHTVSGLLTNAPDAGYQGLFGAIENATVKNVTVEGLVQAKNYSAGIVGTAAGASLVQGCVNRVRVEASNMAGGIMGSASAGVVIEDCVNEADCVFTQGIVDTYSGGIIGYANGVTVRRCTNEGSISFGGTEAGGIVGYQVGGTIEDCVNLATLFSSWQRFGGIVGWGTGTIRASVNYGDVVASYSGDANSGYKVGGIAGESGGPVSDCVNFGMVSGANSAMGGLVGQMTSGSLSSSYNAAPVVTIGLLAAGTVVGCSYLTANGLSLKESLLLLPAGNYADVVKNAWTGSLLYNQTDNTPPLPASLMPGIEGAVAMIDTSGAHQRLWELGISPFVFDAAGVSLTLSKDGKTYLASAGNLMFDFSAVDPQTAGDYPVVVTYGELTEQYTVSVGNHIYRIDVVVAKSDNISADAVLVVTDDQGALKAPEADGSYLLTYGTYAYEVTAEGQQAAEGTFMAASNGRVIIDYSFDPWDGGTRSAVPQNLAGDYLIYNASQLAAFSDMSQTTRLGGRLLFMADIDLANKPWKSIAPTTSTAFSGTIEGNGHTVSGINSSTGLFLCFGRAGESSTARNLSVQGGFATPATVIAGGLFSNTYGTVLIEDCHADVDVSSSMHAGGLVGNAAATTTFVDCTNAGDVACTTTGTSWFAGGINGSNTGATYNGCTNSGAVSGASNVAGIAPSGAGFTDCENTGSIRASRSVAGGISASAYNLVDCVNSGSVTGAGASNVSFQIGGIVGILRGNMTGCVNSGAVLAPRQAGGLFGTVNAAAAVTGCANTGSVTCPDPSGYHIGGLGGESAGVALTVRGCYNTGDVSAVGNTNVTSGVGGLIGHVTAGSSTVSIASCYNAGDVAGGTIVGGLIGTLTGNASGSASVKNCYSAGAVSASAPGSTGGVVGSLPAVMATANFDLSNLFYLRSGQLGALGSNLAGVDACVGEPLSDGYLQSSDFLVRLGGTFGMYDGLVWELGELAQSEEDWLDQSLVERFSGYPYPVLRSWFALGDNPTHNVAFRGAAGVWVRVAGLELYNTTVAPGASVSFEVDDTRYDEVSLVSVSTGGTELVATDGAYEVEGVVADVLVEVVTSGAIPPEPEPQPEVFSVTMATTPAGASIALVGPSGDVAPVDGVWPVEIGTEYSCTVTAPGCLTKSGTFVAGGQGHFDITLVAEGTPARSVMIDSSVAVSLASDGLTFASVPAKAVAPVALFDGRYSYASAHGGGGFTVAGDASFALRKVDFSKQLWNGPGVAFTMSMVGADGTAYTPASTAVEDGNARCQFLVPKRDGKESYHYAFNVPYGYWGEYGEVFVNRDMNFKGQNLSDAGMFVIRELTTVSITVPSAAKLSLHHRVKFYLPTSVLVPRATTVNGNGTTTYVYDAPATANDSYAELHYEVELDGYVKKARKIAPTVAGLTMSIAEADLTPLGAYADPVYGGYAANLLTNLPFSNYLSLQPGDEFEAYLYRDWQAINSGTGNYYVDPPYHLDVVYGDAVEITDPYYAGAVIKAVKPGLAVVKIYYDALDWKSASNSDYLYSRTWPENYGIAVVQVGAPAGVEIDTGLKYTNSDTVYYTRSVNGVYLPEEKQRGALTFTPTAKAAPGGASVPIDSVRVHTPLGDTDWAAEDWGDEKYWASYEANADGSYTVGLTSGKNVVEVSAGGSSSYYAVQAKATDITVTNAAASLLADGSIQVVAEPLAQLNITFSNLELPIAKLGAVTNPGFPNETFVAYTFTGGAPRGLESQHSQYDIASRNRISIVASLAPGLFELTGGSIHTTAIGGGIESHKWMTKSGMDTGYSPGDINPEALNGYFGQMPDIAFYVAGHADKGALDAGIAEAQALLEAGHTPESWAPFASALSAALAVQASPAAVQAEADAALAALQAAQAALVAVSLQAQLSVSGPEAAVVGVPFDVSVSLANAESAATLKLSFELSEGVEFSGETLMGAVEALAGFELLDVYHRPGTRLYGITLGVLGDPAGLAFSAPAEVARLSLVRAAVGTASVRLYHADLARYEGATAVDVPVALPQGDDATVTVTVKDPPPVYQRYDFNRDGKETLADLAFAQLYYHASSEAGGESWAVVAERGMDVSGDGVVDVADYVLVLNYLYHR